MRWQEGSVCRIQCLSRRSLRSRGCMGTAVCAGVQSLSRRRLCVQQGMHEEAVSAGVQSLSKRGRCSRGCNGRRAVSAGDQCLIRRARMRRAGAHDRARVRDPARGRLLRPHVERPGGHRDLGGARIAALGDIIHIGYISLCVHCMKAFLSKISTMISSTDAAVH